VRAKPVVAKQGLVIKIIDRIRLKPLNGIQVKLVMPDETEATAKNIRATKNGRATFKMPSDGKSLLVVGKNLRNDEEVGPDTAVNPPNNTEDIKGTIYRSIGVLIEIEGGKLKKITPNKLKTGLVESEASQSKNKVTAKLQPVWIESPNFRGREGSKVTLIVVHHTAGDNICSTINHFLNSSPPTPIPPCKANKCHASAANYVIDKDGGIIKMVKDEQAAFHAGASRWGNQPSAQCNLPAPGFVFGCDPETGNTNKDIPNINNFSLGIELVHKCQDEPFTKPQYTSLIGLLDRLTKAHGIPRHRVVGHSDIATTRSKVSKENCEAAKVSDLCRLGRKSGDPGHEFVWENLEKAGFGLIPSGSPDLKMIYGGIFADNPDAKIDEKQDTEIIKELQDDLAKIGYSVVTDGSLAGNSGDITARAVAVFQWHFFTGRRHRMSKHTILLDVDKMKTKKEKEEAEKENNKRLAKEFDGVVDKDTAVMIKKVVLRLP
jgi:N-acetyl-anhydromuramyl-L-alanine amidase AmpD